MNIHVCESIHSIRPLYPDKSPLSDHLSGPGANMQHLISEYCISIPELISIAFVQKQPCCTQLRGKRYVLFCFFFPDIGEQ